jgi:hypothetical protein
MPSAYAIRIVMKTEVLSNQYDGPQRAVEKLKNELRVEK